MADDSIQVKQGATEPSASAPVRTPFVDIYESEESLTVVAEMPGVANDGVAVEVEKGVLTISGAPAPADLGGMNPLYEGIADHANFYRAFALSDEVDRGRAAASLKNGVLTVVLPKAPQARTRKIAVQAG